MKQSAWLHACLTLYLRLIECVPLGNWNRQHDEKVLVSILHGHGVDIPYVFGTTVQWQINYSKGPTTKVPPSFGNHIAPDGMHLIISIFLVVAIALGITAISSRKTVNAL